MSAIITKACTVVKVFLAIYIVFTLYHKAFARNVNETKVVVHAHVSWEMADVITGRNKVL
ncbi:MAG: hypothetical protein ACUZ8E_16165 [Candidatus Anammoxibacter sp.]